MFKKLPFGANILIPGLVALATLAGTFYLRAAQEKITTERLVAEITLASSNFAARLETHVTARFRAAELLSLYLQGNGGWSLEKFRSQAEPFHVLFSDLQALNWVDSAGVIRVVTPEDDNAAALGLDITTLPVPYVALKRAGETGTLQVTAPITLAQGGQGFVAYLPVKSEDGIAGYLNIVFRAEPLMRSALGENADDNYSIRVVDQQSLLFESGDAPAEDGPLTENSVEVGGREWRVHVAPTAAYLEATNGLVDEAIVLFGAILALLTAALSRLVIDRQNSLRENRARFEDFASSSSDWFWEMDEDMRVSWFSDGIEKFFGVPRHEFLGRKRGHFRHPTEDTANWDEHFADLAARRPFKDFIYAIKVGEDVKWVRSSGVPRFDDDGTFIGYRGTAADITEYIRSKTEAERANELLANAVENLNELFSLWDENDRLVLGNAKFRELTSDIPDFNVPGTRFADFIRASAERGHMTGIEGREEEYIAQAIARRIDLGSDPIIVTRSDGVILQLYEQRLDNGYIATIAMDITEQRESELALRASEERLALAVKQLTIWDWDIETDKLYMSPGFAEKLGYTPEEFDEIKSGSVASIIHPDDVVEYREILRRHFADPSREFASQHRFRTKSGAYRWYLAIGQSTMDEAGEPVRFNGVMTDITERVELEDQLRQSQSREAIGNLTGGVAHDFNNLLAVIMGNLELIDVEDDPETWAQFVENAIEATKRGADLTRNLLSFARKAMLNPTRLDLNAATSDMLAMLKRVLPETIRIEVKEGADLWNVYSDRSSFENAALNLAINARDAMPDGGVITIETENRVLTETDIVERQEPLQPGSYVVFSLSDTGAGIPLELLGEVFTPYFTTKPVELGTGLGLSMVHGFMRQSGGAVRLYSEVGVGTTVKLFFPALAADAESEVEERAPAPASAVSARVLLAEDNSDLRVVLQRRLASMGLDCVAAASGDEAAVVFDTSGPFDLLITDVEMPGALQGPDLARTLRRRQPDLKIILISGHPSEASMHGDGLLPDDIRLMKPISKQDLAQAIGELFR